MGPAPKPRTTTEPIEPTGHLRLAGIGAGPANLSLAALLHGDPGQPNLFFDRKANFTWHDDQLISGATLQVSIFKDLVSLSDPTNRFSFLSYLHEHGRTYHFLNAQFAEVPRTEFRNYLAWAAETNENIAFSETVERVDFDGVFRVATDRREVTADNIAIGVGTVPWVPEFAFPNLGPTQFHVSEHMRRSRTSPANASPSSAAASPAPRRSWTSSRAPNPNGRPASSGYPVAATTSRSTIRRSPTTSSCRTTPTTSSACPSPSAPRSTRPTCWPPTASPSPRSARSTRSCTGSSSSTATSAGSACCRTGPSPPPTGPAARPGS
ncbi:hypothetical protein GCM10029992_25060 [Glycomyces albus]